MGTSKSETDDQILDYNGILIHLSDLAILKEPCYLNDRIIEFYFSYLNTCYPSQNILLVPPSTSLWIAGNEDVEDFLEPFNLNDRRLVFFPVRSNNNVDANEAEAASHWSLLVFSKTGEVFVHHDSNIGGGNRERARELYEAVSGCMDFASEEGSKNVEPADSPQQVNAYDCGLYVTLIARLICTWFEDGGRAPIDENDLWFSELREKVNPSAVAEMRNQIRNAILDSVPVA